MSEDKNTISSMQFTFAVACFIQSATLLTPLTAGIVHNDTWLVVIFASICFLPIAAILLFLIRRFPDKDLYDINETVFGKIGGKIVSLLYLFFFFTLTTLNIRDGGIFIQQTIMNKTPLIMLLVSFVLLTIYSLQKGLQTVGKYSASFACINIVIIIFSFLTVAKVFSFENLLPVMNSKPLSYVQGTNIMMTIPLGEMVCFLTFAPKVQRKTKGLGKQFFIGYSLGILSFLAVIIRDLGVLGNTIGYYALPSFETLKMSKLSSSIGHLEILFAVALMIMFFFRIVLISYSFLLMLGKILNLKTFRPLIISAMSVSMVYCLFIYKDRLDHIDSGTRLAPVLWSFFEMLLPAATLIVVLIRKKKSR